MRNTLTSTKNKFFIKKNLLTLNVYLIQLVYLVTFLFNTLFYLKNEKKSQSKNFFFDSIFKKKQLNYFKMGANMDSFVKHQIVLIYRGLLNASLFIFDKYSIDFLIKKTTERNWSTLSATLSKLRRNFLGIFKVFWYSTALLLVFVVFL